MAHLGDAVAHLGDVVVHWKDVVSYFGKVLAERYSTRLLRQIKAAFRDRIRHLTLQGYCIKSQERICDLPLGKR